MRVVAVVGMTIGGGGAEGDCWGAMTGKMVGMGGMKNANQEIGVPRGDNCGRG